MPSTETASYTTTAKALHWLIAIAIICMLALGWSFDFLPQGETKFTLYQLHKSIGITILVLSLLRLMWRMTHKAPPLPESMPHWEKNAAHIGHFFLYAVMIGMPLSGWAMVSASPRNIPTVLFGIVPWPALPILSTIDNKQEVSHMLGSVHGTVAYIMAALVVGHAAAALKHHFISHDDILMRMAPTSCARILNRLRGKS